jgi:hypothetical protein
MPVTLLWDFIGHLVCQENLLAGLLPAFLFFYQISFQRQICFPGNKYTHQYVLNRASILNILGSEIRFHAGSCQSLYYCNDPILC